MIEWRQISDAELIFLVLAGIYLWECSFWLRAGAVCLTTGWERHRPARSPLPLHNARGRLVMTGLWPSTTTFMCQEWPIPLDATGLVTPASGRVYTDPAGDWAARWIPYPAAERVDTREHQVLVDGRILATMASKPLADFVAQRLRQLCSAAPQDRETLIGNLLDEQMDAQAIAARLVSLASATAWLRPSCTFLFLLTFACGPIFYYGIHQLGLGAAWILLACFAAAWLAVIVQVPAARRAMCVESRASRIWHVIGLCLSPASAMRAAEAVSRDALGTFHPIAIAAEVCSPLCFIALATTSLRELRYPSPGDCLPAETSAGQAEAWFRQQMMMRVEQTIQTAGTQPAQLLAAPLRSHDAQSYCPRCLNQYVFEAGACQDCGGVTLQRFDLEQATCETIA